MKVMFMVSSLPIRKIGGTEIITLRICDHLSRIGNHEIFLYTIARSPEEKKGDTLKQCFNENNIQSFSYDNILFSPRENSKGFLSYTRAVRSYANHLEKTIKRVKPDCIVAMKVQPPDIFAMSLPKISSRTGVPFLFMVRGFTDLENAPITEDYDSSIGYVEHAKNYFFYRWILPKYIAGAQSVIAQTTAQADFIFNHFNHTAEILQNPIDVSSIGDQKKSVDTPKKIMKEIQLRSEDHFRLVYVGSMIPRKNIPTLLNALKILVSRSDLETSEEQKKGFVLYLIGGGRGEAEAREMVQALGLHDHVVFKGKLPPVDLWDIIRTFDVFVFASKSEGFPNAVLEAMACGLPVISSDFKGVKDIIVDEQIGLIFKRNDPQELADRILELRDDPDTRKRMGEYNRTFVQRFSWDSFILKFDKILTETVNISKK